MDKKVIEVIESYKKSLSGFLADNDYNAIIDKDFDGVIVLVEGCGYFFEFKAAGFDYMNNNDKDKTKTPAVAMRASKFCTIPKLDTKKRFSLMKIMAEDFGIMMTHEKGDDYGLMIDRVFLDEQNMLANAMHAFRKLYMTDDFIIDFLQDIKKK